MRALACLLLAVAGLGASEIQLTRRLDDTFAAMKKIDTAKKKEVDEAAGEATRALLADGPLERTQDGAVRSAFADLLRADGAVLRYDRIGSRVYGAGGELVYLTVSYERGFAFARVFASPTRDDHTVITLVEVSADPRQILPPDLLLPDNATVKR